MSANEAPERLRRAETVLRHRTSRLVLVLEQCMDSHNHQAVLRTAEALGVQHVWLIAANDRQLKTHADSKKAKKSSGKKITKNCAVWLTVREFPSIAACLDALRESDMTIWATDLSPQAEPLAAGSRPSELPARLAVVVGRETDGVSPEMLLAAHRRVYLPLFGFTESLNLSVATALVLQRLLDWFPEVRGDLDEQEKQSIRERWYPQLVGNPTQAAQAEPWTSGRVPIRPLDDLRREKHEAWVPKSVRRREQDMPEVRERLGKRKQPEADLPSGKARTDTTKKLPDAHAEG
ncbi:RNA methyltransferase, TrmH superfamily protein [Phytophthora cinnamomi]|uniref:RNA methyltransferase, TrmH superfamily protein n=1 Tax=Phytophthora cinnamomi TaxID=4785 RepID=UPI003559AD34|nr:RNA methyltransferase, TrmH superfamily protein [Phytophthora cinnamomi]